jgi:hypothetical protein
MSCSFIRQILNRFAFAPGQPARTSRLSQAVRLAATGAVHEASKEWLGLQGSRQSGASARKKQFRNAPPMLRNTVFDSILKSCAKSGDAFLTLQYLKMMRASEIKYLPDAQTAAAVLEGVIASAPGALKADSAIGAMLRLKDNFAIRSAAHSRRIGGAVGSGR